MGGSLRPEDSETDAALQVDSHNFTQHPSRRALPLTALLLVVLGILWMINRPASKTGDSIAVEMNEVDRTSAMKHSLYEEQSPCDSTQAPIRPCGTTQSPSTQAPTSPFSTTVAPVSPCVTTPGPEVPALGPAAPGAPGPGGKTRQSVENLEKETSLAAKAMALKTSNIVYPGGKTVCLNADNEDGGDKYKFQVFPGPTDKLLIYFQGGGGCFDQRTAMTMGACVPTAVPREADGVFDQNNPNNPFKDFTIVQILYCSGDMHGGDRDADMSGDFPISKPQKGYWNAKSAIDWTRANVPSPKILVVSGDSAGSLGAQVWARKLLTYYAGSYEHASVIGDCFFGNFPEKIHHIMFNLYNFCGGLFDADDPVCQSYDGEPPQITMKKVFARTMIDFPNVNFGLISSKHDVIQMSYHDLVSAVACDPNDMVASVAECPLYTLDSARFYQDAIIRFLRPYSQLGNFVSYIVTGHQHTFTGIPIFYNATLSGPCPPDEESDR